MVKKRFNQTQPYQEDKKGFSDHKVVFKGLIGILKFLQKRYQRRGLNYA
jgi:hypothetical protein